jgi:ubiquinone/menaquinone biosynthesis C-methylase UbiE
MEQYNKIAKAYYERRKDNTRFDFNRDIEVPAMIKMIGDVNGKEILDIGCGFGDHLLKLSKKHPTRLVGFDYSIEQLKLAKKLALPNTKLYLGDMSKKLRHDNAEFDVVFSSLAIHYISKAELRKLFSEVNRVLKNGGEFIFSTAHPIFNLLKQRTGVVFESGKDELRIDLNYFDEGPHPGKGQLESVKTYRLTFETLIKTALNAGFQIVDYVETKPSKLNRHEKAQLLFKMPSFVIFKLRKK